MASNKKSGTINNPTGVYGVAKPKEEGSTTASSILTHYSKPIQPTSEDKSKAMGTYRAPAFTEQNSYVSPYQTREEEKILQGGYQSPLGQQAKEKQWLVDDLVREATRPPEYYDQNKVQQKAKAAGLDVDVFFDREKVKDALNSSLVGGNEGISLATLLFRHGLTANGKELPKTIKQYAAAKVATDKGFMRAVDDAIRDNAGSHAFVFDTKDYYSDENQKKFERKPFKLEGQDLFYSLGTVDTVIRGEKTNDGRWLIHFEVEDKYDFAPTAGGYQDKHEKTKAGMINDVGVKLQNRGLLKNYTTQFSGGFLYG